tara:strand:- start:1291 stop:1464 length:174 start_codon:yes stop_codon:yes gene_type:complete
LEGREGRGGRRGRRGQTLRNGTRRYNTFKRLLAETADKVFWMPVATESVDDISRDTL